MPLASAVHFLSAASATDGLYKVLACGLVVALIASVRSWSKGYVCVEERELAGRTFIIDGAFSGTGLSVFQSLAQRGAQVIALHPGPPSPAIVQLVVLLRETTGNERLYADECDLASVDSVRAFVLRWRKDARAGMMGEHEVRLDGVVFLEGDAPGSDSSTLALGAAQKWAPQRALPDERLSRHRMRRLTGRHALVQLLLPVLVKSASTSTSPLRIVSTVSPLYAIAAAQPHKFRPDDLDYTRKAAEGDGEPQQYPSGAPWEAEGRVALAAVLLWRELQARLASLASVKPGSASSSTTAASAAPILALTVCPGLTRAPLFATLAPSLRRAPLRLALAVVSAPLVWLLVKSADEAAQGVLGALLGPVEGESEAARAAKGPEGVEIEKEQEQASARAKGAGKGDDEKEGKRRMRVRGGALYREGREVRIATLDELSPSVGAALWDSESKLVERLLVAAVEAQKREDQEKQDGEASRKEEDEVRPEEAKKDV
ncbi:hypothetical protein JCM3775_003996 [Rhodotorula graminis]